MQAEVIRSKIQEAVRASLKLTGDEFAVVSATGNTVSVTSLKAAQILVWNEFSVANSLDPAEREAVKEDVFDEVARRVAIASMANAWGLR